MKILNRVVIAISIVMVFSWVNIGQAGLISSPIHEDRQKNRNNGLKGHQNMTFLGDIGSKTQIGTRD